MIPNPVSVSFKMKDGREISIETGRLARQADGAVVVRMGNCMLQATGVANPEPKPGQSFFPLTVDYQEKFASAGRIPGSFFKREGRLSDYEVLISRLIDRALRPLFPDDYLCDVQVIITLISSDQEVMPDALACLAASAALAVSDVPIQEIISEVRIARINDEYVINPTRSQLETADMDFIIGATEKNIMMVEGEAKECQEADVVKAIELAHEAIREQIQMQKDLRDKAGAKAKREYEKPYENPELKKRIEEYATEKFATVAKAALGKHERHDAMHQVHKDFYDFALPELKRESRFGDLLLLGSESFYANLGTGQPNEYLTEALHTVECPVMVIPEQWSVPDRNILACDGSQASIFAIKLFSYLFPDCKNNKTLLITLPPADKKFGDQEPYIWEIVNAHFPDCTLMTLEVDPGKYFATWMSEMKSSVLVAGSYSRSFLSELLRHSFVASVIRDHKVPVFIAHP